jgi:hypothetical protein
MSKRAAGRTQTDDSAQQLQGQSSHRIKLSRAVVFRLFSVALFGTNWQVLEQSRVPFHRVLSGRRQSTNCHTVRFYVDVSDPPSTIGGVPKTGRLAHVSKREKNRQEL